MKIYFYCFALLVCFGLQGCVSARKYNRDMRIAQIEKRIAVDKCWLTWADRFSDELSRHSKEVSDLEKRLKECQEN